MPELQSESSEAETLRAPTAAAAALRHHARHVLVATLGVSAAAHLRGQFSRDGGGGAVRLSTVLEHPALAAPIAERHVAVTAG